ncbi:hypothetical protein NYE54_06350 [Paenibacillus sp. FSL K6-1330]|uniref:hypothetical protein n=1 Tax=Paenibacillus sp. FSL K6-1330 TaxID=2975292 RepID=UPI0030D9CC77
MTAVVELDQMTEFAGELRGELSRIRRDLHQHPELLYDVSRTSKLLADLMESWGIEVRRKVGKHFGMGSSARNKERQAAPSMSSLRKASLWEPSGRFRRIPWR